MRRRWPSLPEPTARAADAARAHLAALAATPRPAGSDAEARARAYCARVLADAGFVVREEPFAYSASVGRWAMPLAGVLIAGAVIGAAALARAGHAGAALLALMAAAALVAVGAPWATRVGVLRLPTERRRATNLVATRGGETPAVWLVAHLDSKSQPMPMLARVAGVIGTAAAWVAAVGLALAQLTGASVAAWWGPLVVVAGIVAIPVAGSVIGNRSAGALDNASGVATVLLAATDPACGPPLPEPVGVLLPSAEELGLAGARAWAAGATATAVRRGARVPIAVNVDGVDDAGPVTVLTKGVVPAALADALGREAEVRVRRVPAGVLVDAIALGDAGFAAVTVSRGTPRTLARIHRPADSLANLSGDGIPDAARLVRRLAAGAEG